MRTYDRSHGKLDAVFVEKERDEEEEQGGSLE